MIPLGLQPLERLVGRVERRDLAIDARLAHPAGDELGHLASEIDDEDGFGRGHSRSWGSGCARALVRFRRGGNSRRVRPRRASSGSCRWCRCGPRNGRTAARRRPEGAAVRRHRAAADRRSPREAEAARRRRAVAGRHSLGPEAAEARHSRGPKAAAGAVEAGFEHAFDRIIALVAVHVDDVADLAAGAIFGGAGAAVDRRVLARAIIAVDRRDERNDATDQQRAADEVAEAAAAMMMVIIMAMPVGRRRRRRQRAPHQAGGRRQSDDPTHNPLSLKANRMCRHHA